VSPGLSQEVGAGDVAFSLRPETRDNHIRFFFKILEKKKKKDGDRLRGGVKTSAGIFKQSMGARNRVGIGLSYRPDRLHRLAELIPWNRFLGSLKV
jgi:hypothetical protein